MLHGPLTPGCESARNPGVRDVTRNKGPAGDAMADAPGWPGGGRPRVLVVDDSGAQRRLLAVYLSRWGYDMIEAASGEEALRICMETRVDLVICDWEMTGMSGVDFCRSFRVLPRDGYGYVILLTSRSDRAAIAKGLDAGADDFAAKPPSADELRARLRVGVRIISMQNELLHKNRVVGRMLIELRGLYDALDRDLIEARKLQQMLVRDRLRDFGTARMALLMRASGHVGGDLVGSFRIDDESVALYSVDVSGHGVASAMMAARISAHLSGGPEQNIAFGARPDGGRAIRSPAELAAVFNRFLLEEIRVDQYFTMVFAEVNIRSGRGRLVQAGHPHPLLVGRDGTVRRLGHGGLPIGLVADADWQDESFALAPGERLFLVTDGMTECPGRDGGELGAAGMTALIARFADLPAGEFLEAIVWALARHAGSEEFPDDVSGLVLDYLGPDGVVAGDEDGTSASASPAPASVASPDGAAPGGTSRPVARASMMRSPATASRSSASSMPSQTARCPSSRGGPMGATGTAQ